MIAQRFGDVIWIVQHCLLWIAFVGLELFFLFSIYLQPIRALRAFVPNVAVMLVAVVVMTTAFVVARTIERTNFQSMDQYYGPWSATTLLAYVAWFVAAFFTISRLAWHWSRITDKPWMCRGLRSLAIGSWISMAYGAHKIVYTVLVAAGSPPPWSQSRVENVPVLFGVTFSLVGLILPALGPRLSAAQAWLRYARCYRRLAPLWRAFADETHGVTPDVALAKRVPWWDTTFALQRRVIEIWDGRKRLSPYLDPQVAASALAHGRQQALDDTKLAAVVEAECLREAMRLKRAGGRPIGTATTVPRTGNNLASAVAFLEDVTAAFTEPSQPTLSLRKANTK